MVVRTNYNPPTMSRERRSLEDEKVIILYLVESYKTRVCLYDYLA